MASLAIVNSSAPFANGGAQEALDLAMVAGTFGQQTALFFVDDGVFQLINGQHGKHVGRKNLTSQFGALEFYDIDQLFVCANSLKQRNIDARDLLDDLSVILLATGDLNRQLSRFTHVLRF